MSELEFLILLESIKKSPWLLVSRYIDECFKAYRDVKRENERLKEKLRYLESPANEREVNHEIFSYCRPYIARCS